MIVECCLQERAWNGYYAQLLGSLVSAGKGHRITLQFALWDLIKLVRVLPCILRLFCVSATSQGLFAAAFMSPSYRLVGLLSIDKCFI